MESLKALAALDITCSLNPQYCETIRHCNLTHQLYLAWPQHRCSAVNKLDVNTAVLDFIVDNGDWNFGTITSLNFISTVADSIHPHPKKRFAKYWDAFHQLLS